MAFVSYAADALSRRSADLVDPAVAANRTCIGGGDAVSGSVAVGLLGIEFGWLALAVGAATGRRVLAISVAAALAVASYVLFVAGALVDAIEPWRPLSPFDQAVADGPLGAGLPASFVWVALTAVAVVSVALPVFDRRDIAIR